MTGNGTARPAAPSPTGSAAGHRPLRVLYSFPHPLGAPGIGTTAWHQAEGLVRAGFDVVVTTTSLARPLPGAEVHQTLRAGPVRVPHRALGGDRALAYHDRRTARRLRRADPPFDLVHTWPSAALETLRTARTLGVRGVREVPNTHSAHAYEVVERELRGLGLALPPGHSHRRDPRRLAREEREYHAADALLVPSEHVAETFRRRGYPESVLVRHRYGYDAATMRPGARPEPPGRPFTALFLGRCEPRKGLHHALTAWHAAGAADRGRFVICGTFVPGYRDRLAELLQHPSVRVEGFTDDPASRYRDADVLLLPTVEEGSALVTYEAQALGCVPLVSAAAGACVEDGVHGLVHPAGDVAALERHLRAVLDDPTLLARLRVACRAHAEELTWTAAGEVLADAYRRLAPAVVAAGPGRVR